MDRMGQGVIRQNDHVATGLAKIDTILRVVVPVMLLILPAEVGLEGLG